MFDSIYSTPTPSLCDTCIHAQHVAGGSVTVGGSGGPVLHYRQRYCSARLSPAAGRSIHTSGFQECAFYSKPGTRLTLGQWSKAFDVACVDPDGFDRTDEKLLERLLTREEFFSGMRASTVMGKDGAFEKFMQVLEEMDFTGMPTKVETKYLPVKQ